MAKTKKKSASKPKTAKKTEELNAEQLSKVTGGAVTMATALPKTRPIKPAADPCYSGGSTCIA